MIVSWKLMITIGVRDTKVWRSSPLEILREDLSKSHGLRVRFVLPWCIEGNGSALRENLPRNRSEAGWKTISSTTGWSDDTEPAIASILCCEHASNITNQTICQKQRCWEAALKLLWLILNSG